MNGVELIAAERKRQIKVGWTEEHDDEHVIGELANAASSYAHAAALQVDNCACLAIEEPDFWPWPRGWKPSNDPIRNLVKAGALIAAEIDRLQRQKARESARG